MRTYFNFFLVLALSLICSNTATADIYSYIDARGVIHFTNAPTSPNFKLYLRERHEKSSRSFGTEDYDDIIRKAEQEFDVDFSLIKAVIHAESGFNPKAISKKGAKGLMQIMPDNFRTLSVRDPFNPLENIMGGVKYLQELLQRYQNELPLALAAYNAGPDAVDKYRQIPPFKETQNYVKRVMQLYSQYKNS